MNDSTDRSTRSDGPGAPVNPSRRAALAQGIYGLASLMLAQQSAAALPRPQLKTDDPRHALAQRLADLVIPRSDTPGAADVNTGGFVLFALDAGMSGLSGSIIDTVHAALTHAGGAPFMTLPRAHQATLLDQLDERAYASSPVAHTVEADWRHLKHVILAGYYTTEVGASHELRYEPVPGVRENITIGPDFRMPSNAGFGGLV